MPENLDDEVKKMLQQDLEIELKNDWYQALINYVDYLLEKNFQQLINLLYKVDVSEKKIKLALENQENRKSAEFLAELMLERLKQKAETRKLFKTNDLISEEEKF